MKKKVEDAYNPDKQGRKEKLVLALSGGVDSLVTAYLLKIQKYELIAVTVVNAWDDYTGDQSGIFSCHITQPKLEMMKEFCHKMGIPLHVIKANSEFRESVIEPWMSDRVFGKLSDHCWNCHDLRMNLVYNKMKEIGAKHMATGHYAKLFHNESHGSVFVHTSNDEQHDQSGLLSRLPHAVLDSLVLPLSDLTKKEVLKLAENFGVIDESKTLSIHQCLKWNDEIAGIFEKKIPKKFVREGQITNEDGTINYADHQGVQSHTPGEPFEIREGGRSHKLYFGGYAYSDKRMVMLDENYFIRDKFLLTNCKFSEEVSWIEPLKGIIQFSGTDGVEAWIYPKPLSSAYIELSGPHKLMNGEVLTVMKKKGKNSKVYLTGEVLLLEKEPEKEDGEENVPKINPILDF